MKEKQVTIAHSMDHEFELATMIVQLSSRFQSLITISMDNKKVNAKSIMGMTFLSLMDNDEVTISCDGADEEEAMKELEDLLSA